MARGQGEVELSEFTQLEVEQVGHHQSAGVPSRPRAGVDLGLEAAMSVGRTDGAKSHGLLI